MYCLYVNCFCTVWSTLSIISLKRDFIWFDFMCDLGPVFTWGTFRLTTFCYGLRVERHVSWNQCATGFEIRFLLFGGCVKNVSPISSNMYINHAVLKRPLAQWVQMKSFNMYPLQLGICNNWRLEEYFFICHIQSITSSEMCSLHLTHPSAHTPGAVGVPCSRVSPQSWTIPARAEIQTHNLGLQVRRSIH